MYSDIAQILNNHDIKGFTKYTDHYVLQNGKKNLVKNSIKERSALHNC